MAAAAAVAAGADHDGVLIGDLGRFAVRAIEEVALAGVGEAGLEIAVHQRVVARRPGRQKQGLAAEGFARSRSGRHEVALGAGDGNHVGTLHRGPARHRLRLRAASGCRCRGSPACRERCKASRGYKKAARSPGRAPEPNGRMPSQMNRRRKAGRAAADDEGVVERHAADLNRRKLAQPAALWHDPKVVNGPG